MSFARACLKSSIQIGTLSLSRLSRKAVDLKGEMASLIQVMTQSLQPLNCVRKVVGYLGREGSSRGGPLRMLD